MGHSAEKGQCLHGSPEDSSSRSSVALSGRPEGQCKPNAKGLV